MEKAKPSKLERSSQAGAKYYVVKGKDLLNGMDLRSLSNEDNCKLERSSQAGAKYYVVKGKDLLNGVDLRSLSNEDNWTEP